MAKIKGVPQGDGKKTGPNFSLAAITDSLTKSYSSEKIGILNDEDKKPSEADLMKRLRSHIFALY
jgi:hypothetical protein